MNKRPLILIVDDEPFNVDYLEQELEDLGFDTIPAMNGQEALSQVANHKPDAVILDIMMPLMDGFEVLKQLKADANTRHIPVIIASSNNDMESVLRGIEMGAEDYIVKPINDVLLEARLNASLNKKRWHDQEQLYLREIKSAHRRADDLLHVILPAPIAAELKTNDTIPPREHADVAVMFTDVVGFTAYCDTHSPQEVLANMQQMVEAFERLALKHQLQKIKTIGDAFMAAGGLLSPLDNPVLACVRCGLDMITAVSQTPAQWEIRVGIHVGPLMGGIVGHRQYLYDIWGDTVNTAQRMESNGLPNRVALSQRAWESVSLDFQADLLGSLPVKGKGALNIFTIVH